MAPPTSLLALSSKNKQNNNALFHHPSPDLPTHAEIAAVKKRSESVSTAIEDGDLGLRELAPFFIVSRFSPLGAQFLLSFAGN